MVRYIRYLSEDFRVHIDAIIVGRWLCPFCKKTFRHLPPFLAQHKRFMNQTIDQVAAVVLTQKRKPYRKAVKRPPPNQMSYSYERDHGCGISHSTCWRWIAWMAVVTLAIFSQQPKAATASSCATLERDGHVFAPEQARSAERVEVLHQARWLHLSKKLKFPPDHRQRNELI